MNCQCSNYPAKNLAKGSVLPRRHFLFAAALGISAPLALANLANGDPRLERLFSLFIAPCCWRENLLVHSSPKADELRAEIRKHVQAGKSDDEIKAAFLSTYSTRILAMPEGAKAKWLTWTPWVLSAGGAAWIAVLLGRSKKPQAAAPTSEKLPDLPDSEW